MKHYLLTLAFVLCAVGAGAQSKMPTISGSPSSGDCAQWSSGGALGSTGLPCAGGGTTTNCTTTGNAGQCALFPNDGTDGNTINKASRFKDNTTNEQSTRKFKAGDNFGWATGLIGIVQSGAGTTGSAEICMRGRCNCQFSSGNTPTAGLLVQIDSAAGEEGKCTADGSAGLNEDPSAHNYFARVHTTGAMGSVTDIDMLTIQSFDGAPANAPTIYPGIFPTFAPGGQFLMPSPLALETGTGNATTAKPYISNTTGFRLRNQSNSTQFWDLYGQDRLVSGDGQLVIDAGANALNGGGFKIWCSTCNPTSYSHYTPVWTANVTGSQSWALSAADTWNLTLTGNTTFSSFTFVNPGQISHWNFCQNGTGGWTLTASAIIGLPTITTTASACTRFGTIAIDSTHIYAFGATSGTATNAGVIYTNDATAQVAAITDTTMYTPGAAGVYRFTGTINCTTTSAAATATLNLKYTDTGNTAQTVSVTDTCTALVTTGIPQMVTAIRSKSGTAITWGVTIANTPTYDVSVRLEAM